MSWKRFTLAGLLALGLLPAAAVAQNAPTLQGGSIVYEACYQGALVNLPCIKVNSVLTVLPTISAKNTFSALNTFSLNTSGTATLANSPVVVVGQDAAGANLPVFAFGGVSSVRNYRADGTAAAPTALASGDPIAANGFFGWNGTAYKQGAQINCATTEAWTTSTNGMMCALAVTPAGSSAAPATQWAFYGDRGSISVPLSHLAPTRYNPALGLSAAGTTLATATALTQDINEITTVASGSGVSIPPYTGAIPGIQRVEVINAGANPLNVWPPTTGTAIRVLNGSSAAGSPGAAVTLAVGTHGTFECVSSALCYEAP